MRKSESTEKQKLTPPEVARSYGVKEEKILAWIRSGELRAFNAATRPTGRPRFLIDKADLEAFENSRAVVPPPKKTRRRDWKSINANPWYN